MGVLGDDSGVVDGMDELDPEDMEHSAFEFIQSNTSFNQSNAPIKVDEPEDS